MDAGGNNAAGDHVRKDFAARFGHSAGSTKVKRLSLGIAAFDGKAKE